jgi:hypothetical protein
MRRATFAIIALLCLPAWSYAGGKDNAVIAGTVQDSAGRTLAGALVSLVTAEPTGLDRLVLSDSRGAFSFENLVPGDYLIQVMMPHFVASDKEKVRLPAGSKALVSFTMQSITEVMRRAASRDAKQSQAQDIVLTLRSARGSQSVLRFSDSPATPVFQTLSPDYSGFIQLYSKADPSAQTGAMTRGSRFSLTVGLPANAKMTVSGQYNESPLEPKGASAVYEFQPVDRHETRIGLDVRQGVVLDDVFSAEDLKQFQGSYLDKFYLNDQLVLEQGAQFGHAEGRFSNNYMRPRGNISWIPNDSTVISVGFNTQAPTQGDDPVRSREYFEQVNLPPSYEHYLHTEIGATRFIDDSTKVSLALFKDQANYRALFVTAPDGRHGLLIVDGKRTPSQGFRLFVNREFKGIEAGLGYTLASGPAVSPLASTLDDVRSQMDLRKFQVVTARIKADFDLTNTELTAVYRWVSKYAATTLDPYQQNVEYSDPTLSISIAQNLPTFGAIPAKVQAIFDARNLLERPVGSSSHQLTLSPRYVKGGINIRF